MTDSEHDGMSRQQRVGAAARAETRARLESAATQEFIEHGYAAATVSRIAARAGVTVQTLYLACGSKRELLRASMLSSVANSIGSQRQAADRVAGLSPTEVVAMMAAFVRRVAETSAPGWKVYRDAAAVDDEIAADWNEVQRMRRVTFEGLVAHIPVEALRHGLDHAGARDTAWTIASPEAHELLVLRAGYSLDEFEEWLRGTLLAALLGR